MTSLPKTYKVAIFEEKDAPLKLKDVELKQPEDGQILVKVLASGVCHSDAFVQNGGFGNSFPIVPGHEVIGDVVAVGGKDPKGWKVGDRVGGPWHGGHDFSCTQCQRGQFQMCKNEAINGVTRDGGYGQYVILRSEATVKVPKEVDPAEYAPILCAGVTVFNAIRQLKITPGELVAIQGLGGLGHLAVQYANKMGYRVAVLSSSDKKRDFAIQLGAHEYIDSSKEDTVKRLNELGGAALIVCTAPSSKLITPLTGGIAAAGHLLILAPSGLVEINSVDLIMRGISVSGWPAGHALDSEEAIAFSQLHNIKCMVEKFPLEDAQKALDHMLSNKVRFRSVLVVE